MKISFWGSRGSLPTPLSNDELRSKMKWLLMNAKDVDLSDETAVDSFLDKCPAPCAMTYGDNTPCVEVTEGSEQLILDCGSGLRRLGYNMMKNGFVKGSRINIFQTHTHWDHIMGFPFFSPALAGAADIHFYGVHPKLRERFEQQMDRIHFPITMDEMSADITFHQISNDDEITIGPFSVTNKALYHPGGSYSYRITSGGKSVVFATDGEYTDTSNKGLSPYIEFFRGADVLIFDAMYPTLEVTVEKENYGHSTAVIGVDLALYAAVHKLVLFHHDPESDDLKIVESMLNAQEFLRKRSGEFPGSNLEISTAYDSLVMDV